MMKTLLLRDEIRYDASQLRPHWIYRQHGLLGDAIVAFFGPAQVDTDKMMDLKDIREKEAIYSPRMLHFIAEHFDTDLEKAIYRQFILTMAIKEELELREIQLQRIGDDLYRDRGKLSVSIATSTVVSTIIHTGINVETEGTPVKTIGLKEMGITDLPSFAEYVMLRYKRELERIYEARCKARGIFSDI